MLRMALGSALAGGAMWVTGVPTFALIHAGLAPDSSLAAWPTSLARSGVAARFIDGHAKRGDVEQADQLARLALARSPVNVEAASILAWVETGRGHVERARELVHYAERLSRRDVRTELWLIEDRSAAGDVRGTLQHYHRAMQTSPASRDLLSPILAQAADDPAITRPLAQILRTRPEWWSNFLGDFVERTHSPAALALVTRSLRLDPAVPVERERLSTILQRYVTLGDAATARRLFEQITGSPANAVSQGDFERDASLAPFGWQLTETAAGAALREARNGANGRFALTLDGNEGLDVARQLLVLPPGNYVMRLSVGSVRPDFTAPPSIAVTCLPGDTPIVESDMPTARTVTTVRVALAIPSRCATQMLSIRTARATSYIDDKPWIDDVEIRPTAGSADGQ